MQLNPHFLFNTLNTIAALIHDQPETTDRVVIRLGELLRASLDRPDTHEIPLRQEFDFLRRYLEIEQARFGERPAVEFQVPADVTEALVPALVLQPVVENAIRHGIESRETGGRIVVAAARQNGRLELCIVENGPGLPTGEAAFAREGVGLSSTRSRLRHLYGDCQDLMLRREDPTANQ
jgi:LytS/YehU family sensor histidine kinase